MLLVAPGGHRQDHRWDAGSLHRAGSGPRSLHPPSGQGLFLFKEISLATFPALKPKLADKTNTCKWPRLGF